MVRSVFIVFVVPSAHDHENGWLLQIALFDTHLPEILNLLGINPALGRVCGELMRRKPHEVDLLKALLVHHNQRLKFVRQLQQHLLLAQTIQEKVHAMLQVLLNFRYQLRVGFVLVREVDLWNRKCVVQEQMVYHN
jgi:hypothetical protein